MPMSLYRKLRLMLLGVMGKLVLWLWAKSTRMRVVGEEGYRELRRKGKAVIFLVWHGRIFIVPFFFRRRRVAALVSPSEDGEIVSQILSRWGFRLIRGSGSHAIMRAWSGMKKELERLVSVQP